MALEPAAAMDPPAVAIHGATGPWRKATWLAAITALTVLTLLVHGYHPLAEDGGLYVAGVEYTLDPKLFPHCTAFVREHLRFSVFAPLLASFIRMTHLPLAWALLLADLASLWLTLFAARQVLRRCVASPAAQLTGVALLAAWWTLPIAGTSLLLMDPYVTARSFSTPLSLLAIAFALDRWKPAASLSLFACLLCLALAFAFHPLMAGYAFALVLLLRLMRSPRRKVLLIAFTVAALAMATVIQTLAPPESPAEVAAVITRYYWFLSQWQWFELLGLLGPIAVLAAFCRWSRSRLSAGAANLCSACLALGFIAVLIALLFAHEGYRTHAVARLQPLRAFLFLYAVMALLLGAALADACTRAARRSPLSAVRGIPTLAVIAMATIMFCVQRASFPASRHLELPWRAASNPNSWVQAFLWARSHTPPDALFALDARYINTPGEDAQTFRATAQRSALPDYSKDGGEASITPQLAGDWLRASSAQAGLSGLTDAARDARLKPFGVTWMVLHSSARTTHPCPYANAVVKICRVAPAS